MEKIVPGSYHGNVDILFIAANAEKWGSYDSYADKVTFHTREETCDVDLLDFIAGNTIVNGGEVYAVDADRVPGGNAVAAVFRY
jgi:hypothetical protein